MRKIGLGLALLLALLAGLTLWFTRQDSSSAAAEPAVDSASGSASADSSPAEPPPGTAQIPQAERVAIAEQPAAAPATADGTCIVRGRAVDENDAPLEGVKVRLSAWPRWSVEHEGPPMAHDARLHGWELATNALGEFRFAVPPADPEGIQALELRPVPFHDLHTVRFGRDGLAALQAGETDLGTIRLSTTGALSGVVRDTHGNPLAKARVRVASSRGTTVGREAETDADGRFVIGHVKPGTWGVNCALDRYVSQFRQPFEVALASTTGDVDFVLVDSPTLSGRVVDVAGVPQEGLRVWGWPQSSGSGTGATTGPAGEFTLFLPQDEPYRLEVKLDATDVVGVGDPTTHYPPGARDVELVVPTTTEIAVTVVDAQSGALVDRFSLRVERGEAEGDPPGSSRRGTTSAPQPRPRESDELRVRVRPGIDSYWLVATGYDDLHGEFGAELARTRQLRIELGPGKALRGRAVNAGTPVADVLVTLQPGQLLRLGAGPEPEFSADTYRQPRVARSGADGRFEFRGVAAGTAVSLSLAAADGARAERVVSTASEGDIELGDFELLAPGSIVGTVLTPPARSPVGLVVRLDERSGNRSATVAADGHFRFESVAPGTHQLEVEGQPGRITASGEFPVEVRAGEVTTTELDLRSNGTCNVDLGVRFSDGTAEGGRVSLLATNEALRDHDLGFLGANSRVVSWAPAVGEVRVVVRAADGSSWRHPTARLELVHDRDLVADVLFEVASLSIGLPEGFVMPTRPTIELAFLLPDSERDWAARLSAEELGGAFTLQGDRLAVARVPAGALIASLSIVDRDQKPKRVELAPGRFRVRMEPALEQKASLELVPGRETHWRLE